MRHTVKQGETLSRIARQYGFSSAQVLYDHPENQNFRQLRTNPDIIYPGDKVFIPEKTPTSFKVKTNKKTTFTVKREKEILRTRIKLEDESDDSLASQKAILAIADQQIESQIAADGFVEWKLPKKIARHGVIRLFLDEEDKVTHEIKIDLGSLDPVTESSGVQARLNALGFYCGEVDNKIKEKSEQAIKKFQTAKQLTVDGIAGPITQAELENQYGC
jgi:N-acetylmuramoyl-L-alanine amidase